MLVGIFKTNFVVVVLIISVTFKNAVGGVDGWVVVVEVAVVDDDVGSKNKRLETTTASGPLLSACIAPLLFHFFFLTFHHIASLAIVASSMEIRHTRVTVHGTIHVCIGEIIYICVVVVEEKNTVAGTGGVVRVVGEIELVNLIVLFGSVFVVVNDGTVT